MQRSTCGSLSLLDGLFGCCTPRLEITRLGALEASSGATSVTIGQLSRHTHDVFGGLDCGSKNFRDDGIAPTRIHAEVHFDESRPFDKVVGEYG